MSEQEGSAGNHPNAGPSGAEREGITANGPEGDEQGPGEGAKVNDPSQGDGGEHPRAGGTNGEDGPTPEEEAEAQAEAEAAAEEAEASEHGN